MNKRVTWVYVLLLLSILLLSGCGIGKSSPEAKAKEWLEAALSQDMDTLMKLTCSADRDTVMETGYYMLLLGGVANYFGLDVETSADLSDLKFIVVEKNKQSATVNVNGSLFLSVNQMPMEIPFDDIWFYLIKEDGEWRVCSDPNTTTLDNDNGDIDTSISSEMEEREGPSAEDMSVGLPEGKEGFFLVIHGELFPLSQWEERAQSLPVIRNRFPVVLLRSNEINVIDLQMIRLIAGMGFSMEGTNKGVLVTDVRSESPAEAMGLQTGDIILAVNGVDVNGDTSKVRHMIPAQFNQEVEFKVLRGTQTLSLSGQTDVAVDWELVAFEFEPSDSGYIRLFPKEPLSNGAYCYVVGGVWAAEELWCFTVEAH